MHKHVRFLCSGSLNSMSQAGDGFWRASLDVSRKTSPSYCQELQLQRDFPACRDDGHHPPALGTPSPRRRAATRRLSSPLSF